MSLTKRWLETQPTPERQALDAARRYVHHAARIIEAESPLDWQDREAAGRVLADALRRLVELESMMDADQRPYQADYYAADFAVR